ncbi:MAG: glycosyltransferase, partial [Planctomycetota bacterium]
MNTLHVDSQRHWRGGENQALLLTRGLRERGAAVAAVGRPGTPWADRMAAAGFDVFPNDLKPSPPALLALRGIYRRFEPDIVHCHDSGCVFPVALAATGLGRKRPKIVVSRRVDFAINTAFKYNHLCDRVIAIGRAVTDVLEQGGVAADRIRIVASGIDPARFAHPPARAAARAALT